LHADLTPLTFAFGFSPRTPRYAAPEQFDLRHVAPIDFRTDQFLVGIVVFEALTGSHPFMHAASGDYVAALRGGNLDETALGLVANNALAQLLRRLLRPNPHERYRTPEHARRAVAEARA
jgi:serine/threonine protein kinase